MEFYRGDHVALGEPHHSASRQNLDLALRCGGIYFQFPSSRRVILLQHL